MARTGRAIGERFGLTRQVLPAISVLAGGCVLATPATLLAQEATAAGSWSYTDLIGTTVSDEAKVAEVEQLAAERPELTVLFGSYGDDGLIYIAGPDDVGDLGHARSLGLKLANDGSPTATEYWEALSLEQALSYPSDVLYIDQYGAWRTIEDLQAHPTIGEHPAVKAGQAGPWERDLPLSYAGLARFLENLLGPLRDATNVT